MYPSTDHTQREDSRSRFVVVFDTDDARILGDLAPAALDICGFSAQQYFPRLGIAVVEAAAPALDTLTTHCTQQRILVAVLPETTYYALETAAASFVDTAELTWGVQAVRAAESGYTGAGIRIAVLDTGFTTDHPDFAGRGVIAASFIDGEGPEDPHGHGTHCVGTAAGPRSRPDGPGYGVAPEAQIYSGKVLGRDGSGTDTTILAGIDWALQHQCQIISMSLGADIRDVHPPYVAAGRRALEQGCLIVAAAGNNAARDSGNPGFVGTPANSPHIMAVGAVDQRLQVADFSARATPGEGGEIDIAAPGVGIYSSWVAPQMHHSISGTSMAAPHVAGVAALIAEATGARGSELWEQLIASASPLDLPREDVGAGLSVATAAARDATAPQQQWVITVDDEHAHDLDLVTAQLRRAGVHVTRTLPQLGMIYALSPASLGRDVLVGITGVASADANQHHRVNPPEAEVQ